MVWWCVCRVHGVCGVCVCVCTVCVGAWHEHGACGVCGGVWCVCVCSVGVAQ